MRLSRVVLVGYRSIDYLDFEIGPFTVLFGKNNTGKTNVLEAIYEILASGEEPGPWGQSSSVRGLRGVDDVTGIPRGAAYVQLDRGSQFDNEVASLGNVGREIVPVGFQVHSLPSGEVALVRDYEESLVAFVDPGPYFLRDLTSLAEGESFEQFKSTCAKGPRPQRLFLDWDFDNINERVGAALLKPLMQGGRTAKGRNPRRGWSERIDDTEVEAWRVRPEIHERVASFAELATSLLPDFIRGSIRARFCVPNQWGQAPWVSVEFEDEDTGLRTDSVNDIGRGAARWIAVVTQLAQHLVVGGGLDAEHVLFLDEPEAHLHPSAVASAVRWCQRMVGIGLNVVVASHHEEFLRAAGDEFDPPTLVRIARELDTGRTIARTLPSASATRLLELADDVGMRPAAALSIHRAILFVEGPLDEAVLDEYGGIELDAAGVKVIPIHGTRNLEGLIAVELVAGLGIKTGILTDATDPATMAARSGRKRSSEERKVLRVIQIAEEKGVPTPTSFGVPEADLLFALPADAIREHLNGPFPGWKELVAECREHLGKGPSDSVDWKSFANERYGLQISTPVGVRELVRRLDLAKVPLPSIRAVLDDIVAWAKAGN
ncbi:TOPRIM nucleotidyl transferase/hydrolase domain-containing protein [Mycobacterium sp. PSTR-4-N]|uniref:ATP-dependent nuclease n=1 Tax=Mycobacterium sp. PSTR-4-N TaxID=2917745 RepID=UPI001F15137F|nr:AAA family ATPase [Mycobacterium sp. PSTR-4-N]MCG7594572.1 hypothetical protein [Mycobacterium sp. PSTR-4-N]